jgi:hypothetical protein
VLLLNLSSFCCFVSALAPPTALTRCPPCRSFWPGLKAKPRSFDNLSCDAVLDGMPRTKALHRFAVARNLVWRYTVAEAWHLQPPRDGMLPGDGLPTTGAKRFSAESLVALSRVNLKSL